MLLSKLKAPEQPLAYAQRAIWQGWSRTMLEIHIENRLLKRAGRAVSNFAESLPVLDTDLAEDSVIRNFRVTGADGKSYDTKHYNLAASYGKS